MQIRKAKTNDCSAYLVLLRKIEREGNFMHYELGDLEPLRFLKDEQKAVFLAEEENQLIGYTIIAPIKNFQRDHVARVIIGVLNGYQRQGVGTQLLGHGKQWAARKNIHRLELTVSSQNIPAISFYLKHDFAFEGIRKQSLLIDGQWYNELYMGYILKS